MNRNREDTKKHEEHEDLLYTKIFFVIFESLRAFVVPFGVTTTLWQY